MSTSRICLMTSSISFPDTPISLAMSSSAVLFPLLLSSLTLRPPRSPLSPHPLRSTLLLLVRGAGARGLNS